MQRNTLIATALGATLVLSGCATDRFNEQAAIGGTVGRSMDDTERMKTALSLEYVCYSE